MINYIISNLVIAQWRVMVALKNEIVAINSKKNLIYKVSSNEVDKIKIV